MKKLRSEDLAFHLEKLYVQSYIDYYIRSTELFVSLTENGFNVIGAVDFTDLENKEEQRKENRQEKFEKEEVQTKITEVIEPEEDLMKKRARTKREFYFKKYGLYYVLGIILILIILGLIYFFYFMGG